MSPMGLDTLHSIKSHKATYLFSVFCLNLDDDKKLSWKKETENLGFHIHVVKHNVQL